jgi:hypothetical protein
MLFMGMALGHVPSAKAHSTKGRVKMDMNKETPTIDDFAYFMESHVHTDFYKTAHADSEKRFYVKEFIGVTFPEPGKKASVRFITLDTKTNKNFEDVMNFVREDNGSWYVDGTVNDGRVTVFTFVTKSQYYLLKYPLVFKLGPGFLAAALVVYMLWSRVRRRTRRGPLTNE